MTTRNYSSRSQQTTLTSAVTAGASTIVVQSGTALLGGQSIPAGTTFTIVVDPDTALEEILDATAVSTNTFSVTRAIDGSSAQAHSAGAVVRHMAIGRDYREANTHIEASTGVHGISNASSVVGTTDTQILTNKTLTSPTITNPSISGAGVDASIVFEGATADAYETTLTVVDPTQDNTITLPNTTGTVVIATATQTLTNKTLTSPIISGSPVITGLSSAGMSASSATPKDYVDSILGSATSAATSAASAATSAASAATSAASAATSATASASSATASASSATAAATSATSAAASATAAATSATSAANSATTAANSVATIAGYATSAANSATAAATSATSAAASATAAATSAASAAASTSAAAASATAAATSATSASNSATAAATSATSAATSATAAATSAASAATSAATAAAAVSAAFTSKGALLVGTGVGSYAVQTVGTDGQVLAANSAQADGVEWITPQVGDITAVTAGTGLTGGGTSGAVSLAVDTGVIQARVANVSDTEIGYLDGVTSAIQTQLDSKLASATAATTYVPNSLADAKGDIFVATADNTLTRLPVGNSGEQLVADSSTSTGLRYQGTIAAGKNFVINGGFDIWQRATSATLVTIGSYIAPDRMACTSDSGGNGTASQVTSSLPTGFRYGLKLQRTAGNTSTGIISVAQFLETSNSIPLSGQTVTLSFWAKAGANFSAGSSALLVRGFTGTGTDQAGGFGTWTGYAEPISANPLITTSWVRYSVTGTLASTATQFGFRIGYTPAGTAGADDSLQITGIQAEIGSVPTNFLRNGATIQGELAACQRYFYKYNASATTGPFGAGNYYSSTLFITALPMKQTMRITPVLTFNNPTSFTVFSNGGSRAATAITTDTGNPDIVSISVTTSAATAGNGGAMNAGSSNASIDFNSEL
jgi:hypothetical protein